MPVLHWPRFVRLECVSGPYAGLAVETTLEAGHRAIKVLWWRLAWELQWMGKASVKPNDFRFVSSDPRLSEWLNGELQRKFEKYEHMFH